LAGVTLGGSYAKNFRTGAVSITAAYDIWGSYILVITPEVGFDSGARLSGFARVVAGVNNDVRDLAGDGASISAQFRQYSASITQPLADNAGWPIAELGVEGPIGVEMSVTYGSGVELVSGNFFTDLSNRWDDYWK
jgi:hypothetical protein